MTDELEVISAFIDGERVDHDALKRALADPQGREYLVDLLSLRESVAEMTPQTPVAPGAGQSAAARVLRISGIAATLLLAIAGGYVAGHRSAGPPAGVAEHVSAAPASTLAPAPTRIIKLEPGVNWIDHNGGQR
jgi:hypothetical protein